MPVAYRDDGQAGAETEEAHDQDQHAVQLSFVGVDSIDELGQLSFARILVSLQTWKHVNDELGIDLVL